MAHFLGGMMENIFHNAGMMAKFIISFHDNQGNEGTCPLDDGDIYR